MIYSLAAACRNQKKKVKPYAMVSSNKTLPTGFICRGLVGKSNMPVD